MREIIAKSNPLPTLDYQAPTSPDMANRRMIPIVEAIPHIIFGGILPIVCFVLAAKVNPAVDRPWQSGRFEEYVGLITRAACAWPFYPLLAYCIASLCIAVISPLRGAAQFPVRLGVYTGVILSIQFCIIQIITLGSHPTVILVAFFGTAVLVALYDVLRWASRQSAEFIKLLCIGPVALLALVLVALVTSRRVSILLGPGILLLAIAPMLSLASYFAVARLMFKHAERTSLAWLWLPWGGAYSVAWWICVARVLDEYATLPKTAPSGCYIVSAAAGGHPQIVHSTRIKHPDGTITVTNLQLRRLKCAELCIAQLAPNLHRVLRAAYKRAGPRVARCISIHPILCDAAYCSLKPLEWSVVAIVRSSLRSTSQLADQILKPKAE